MISVIRALFWLWVLTSLVILIYRAVRKVSNRDTTDTLPAPSSPLPSAQDQFGTSSPLPPLGGGVAPSAPPAPAVPSDLIPPGGVPPRPVEGGSIFDPPSARADALGGGRPIAELVAGIRMPCDLAPLVDQTPRAGTRESVSFATRGFDAVDVGRAVGDELRRLGFELEPVTATRVRATRDDGSLEVEVHPDASIVEHSGLRAYPNAQLGTIAVEIWR